MTLQPEVRQRRIISAEGELSACQILHARSSSPSSAFPFAFRFCSSGLLHLGLYAKVHEVEFEVDPPTTLSSHKPLQLAISRELYTSSYWYFSIVQTFIEYKLLYKHSIYNLTMSSPPSYEPGMHIIPPARAPSPATSSFRLNHLMLRIKDPEASLRFYNDCLGMHTVFVFNTGGWTIYYLGPRDTGMHNLGTSSGLLELYHIPADEAKPYRNGNENGGEGFGHIGFTVPDVDEALQRVSDFGYKIIKPLGEAKASQFGVPESVKDEHVAEGYKQVFKQLAFVLDPDVSLLEMIFAWISS